MVYTGKLTKRLPKNTNLLCHGHGHKFKFIFKGENAVIDGIHYFIENLNIPNIYLNHVKVTESD